jgi:uncharacterized membrane protein
MMSLMTEVRVLVQNLDTHEYLQQVIKRILEYCSKATHVNFKLSGHVAPVLVQCEGMTL